MGCVRLVMLMVVGLLKCIGVLCVCGMCEVILIVCMVLGIDIGCIDIMSLFVRWDVLIVLIDV